MLGTVNTVVLSGFSDDAVAAVGAVSPVLGVILLVFYAISTGATVVISYYIGTEKLSDGAKVIFSALCVSALIGAGFAAALYYSDDWVVGTLNLQGAVKEYACTYYRIRVLAIPVTTLSSALLAILRCYGFTGSTVVAGLSSNAVNLAVSACVVYWLPTLFGDEVSGVAFACVIGQTVSLAIGAAVFRMRRIPIRVPRLSEFFIYVKKILRIGVPGMLSSGSLTFSQVVSTPFIALLGMTALSSKAYFDSILGYAYLFSYSMGSANALLVGRLCGAGEYEHADRLNRQLRRITCAVNLLISVSIIVLRVPLLSFFTDSREVLQAALWIFAIDVVAEQARAVSQVYEYALRAAGDVLFSTVIITASCWVCGVGLCYLLSIPCGLGLVGVYTAVAIDETVRAICTVCRWKSGKWRKLKL